MEISGFCIRSRGVATSCWELRRVRVGCVLKYTYFKREQAILLPKCLTDAMAGAWLLLWLHLDKKMWMYNSPPLRISVLCLLFEVTPLCFRIQEIGA